METGNEYGLKKIIRNDGIDMSYINFMDEIFSDKPEFIMPDIPPNFLTSDGAYNQFVHTLGVSGSSVNISNYFDPNEACTDYGVLIEHRKQVLKVYNVPMNEEQRKEEEEKDRKREIRNARSRKKRLDKQELEHNQNISSSNKLNDIFKSIPSINEVFRINIVNKLMDYVRTREHHSAKRAFVDSIKRVVNHIITNQHHHYTDRTDAMVGAVIINIEKVFDDYCRKLDDEKLYKKLSKNNGTYITISSAFKSYYMDYLYELHTKFLKHKIELQKIEGFHTDTAAYVDDIEPYVLSMGVECIMKFNAILKHIIDIYINNTIPIGVALNLFDVLDRMKNPNSSVYQYRPFYDLGFSYEPWTMVYPNTDMNPDKYQPITEPDIPIWENMNYERLPNEYWKAIPGYTNYLVSNFGRIKCRDVVDKGKKNKTGRIINQQNKDGLLHVSIHKDNKRKEFSMAYLVGVLWVDKEGKSFTHIDGNKHNNKADNLQVISKRIDI